MIRWLIVFLCILCAACSLRAAGDDALADEAETLIQKQPDQRERIYELCRRAAELGSVKGQHLLGHCYAEGWGVKANAAKAFRYYRMAAQNGYPPALNSAGFSFLHGIGVEKNVVEAYAHFVEAALMGDRNARYNLGYLYENGISVQKDLPMAIYWYRQAAQAGSAGAAERIKALGLEPASPATMPTALPSAQEAVSASVPQTTKNVEPLTPSASPVAEKSTVESDGKKVSSSFDEARKNKSSTPHIFWWIISAALVAGGFWWWKKKLRMRKSSETNFAHDNAALHEGMTFSCIECGQQLLIPSLIFRRTLECPVCRATYEYWKDASNQIHLENIHQRNGRKTKISFGQSESSVSPYEVLGVRRGCSAQEVRDAFKRKMKEYHPDRVAALGEELRELAASKSREINHAYEELMRQKAGG